MKIKIRTVCECAVALIFNSCFDISRFSVLSLLFITKWQAFTVAGEYFFFFTKIIERLKKVEN